MFGAVAAVASSSASFPLEVVRCVPRAPRGLRPVVHGAAPSPSPAALGAGRIEQRGATADIKCSFTCCYCRKTAALHVHAALLCGVAAGAMLAAQAGWLSMPRPGLLWVPAGSTHAAASEVGAQAAHDDGQRPAVEHAGRAGLHRAPRGRRRALQRHLADLGASAGSASVHGGREAAAGLCASQCACKTSCTCPALASPSRWACRHTGQVV